MGKNKNKNRGNSMTSSDDTTQADFTEYPITDDADTNVIAVGSEEEPDTPMNPEPKKETDMSTQPEPEKVVPASKTVTLPKQSTNVDKLTVLTSKFDEAYDKNESTIGALISICNYLNTTNDPKVFKAFTTWFAQHSDTSMDDTRALRGIHTIQNKKTKTRVEATHQCFVELIRVLKMRPRGRYRFTVRAMRAMEISENLAQWIIYRATN